MKQSYLTQTELQEIFPGVKPYKMDYLVRIGILPVIKRGRGYERLFLPEAIDIIKYKILKMRLST